MNKTSDVIGAFQFLKSSALLGGGGALNVLTSLQDASTL